MFFLKNQRSNINEREEKALKKLAQRLIEMSDNQLSNMVANANLYEVPP